ncbi:putative diguanylate cyclase [Escherichia coli]|nr:putative diguanylate cyclase [Escherichia coli]
MSRINKFVLTVSLLIFIMISAVACGIYTQMVKERVYSLKQSVIDMRCTGNSGHYHLFFF